MIEEKFLKTLLKNKSGRKALAAESPLFFMNYYLGHETPAHFNKWMKHLKYKRVHQEAPRDHGKSTFFSQGYVLWYLCTKGFSESIRILLISRTGGAQGISSKLKAAILTELKQNERILEDYGYIVDDDNTKGGVIFVKRAKRGIKDPSLESVGYGGAITGGHYDLIICDDIIDEDNSRTPLMRQQVEDWFKGTITELLEPHSQFIVVGTRKHYDDLYQGLIDNKIWKVYVDVAIEKYPEYYEVRGPGEDGYDTLTEEWAKEEGGELQIIDDIKIYVKGEYRVLWPEKWSIFQLLYNRYDIGSVMFNREKQNDPSGMKGKVLNPEWIQYYKLDDLPSMEEMIIYMGVDLAQGKNNIRDYVATCVVGWSPTTMRIYVLDFWHGHLTFPEQIAKIKEKAYEWAPTRISIENNQYQDAMVQYLDAFTMLPVFGTYTAKDKIARMIGLSPNIENGKIMFNESLPYWDPFLEEYIKFPKAKNDDMLDSLDICCRPIFSSGETVLGTFMEGEVIGSNNWFSTR